MDTNGSFRKAETLTLGRREALKLYGVALGALAMGNPNSVF